MKHRLEIFLNWESFQNLFSKLVIQITFVLYTGPKRKGGGEGTS